MNSISQILQHKRKYSTLALIPFITAGYPSISLTIQALLTLDKKGADIIELGIPYADALADGPLIQHASKIALRNGVYIDQVLNILEDVQFKINVPIIIFTYYNPILVRGLSRFIKEISERGAQGLIIPDLPIEEIDYLLSLCESYKLELILFISPTSSNSRIANIVYKAPGCVYLVSTTGVTGMRDSLNSNINCTSNYIQLKANKLVMLGFGISSPEQVSFISKSKLNIDGIVVGSAFTNIFLKDSNDKQDFSKTINKLGNFCEQMKEAIM
uniref:Tryptophan synthase alpha chain n=1 Tax=Dipterosiphonia australica TaxID=2007208 RepID=A0A1Z1MLG7_9FLOR|nr:Tryptophan synthase alpha subunit [Dipterosiphonia australica]ARW66776.1 Tryptophan synthase alpha subunit [Dipterosiphonia australica]